MKTFNNLRPLIAITFSAKKSNLVVFTTRLNNYFFLMSKSKFIGEAGEHFVAYKLNHKKYYVGLTIGNMSDVENKSFYDNFSHSSISAYRESGRQEINFMEFL